MKNAKASEPTDGYDGVTVLTHLPFCTRLFVSLNFAFQSLGRLLPVVCRTLTGASRTIGAAH